MQTIHALEISFPILLLEAFGWAFLLGCCGARKWLSVPISVLAVTAMYVGRDSFDLYLQGMQGSTEAFITLGAIAGIVFLMTLAVALIGASAGSSIWQWISSKLWPEEEEEEEAASESTEMTEKTE